MRKECLFFRNQAPNTAACSSVDTNDIHKSNAVNSSHTWLLCASGKLQELKLWRGWGVHVRRPHITSPLGVRGSLGTHTGELVISWKYSTQPFLTSSLCSFPPALSPPSGPVFRSRVIISVGEPCISGIPSCRLKWLKIRCIVLSMKHRFKRTFLVV